MIYSRYDYNWITDNNILAVISYNLDFDVIRIHFFYLNPNDEIISLKKLHKVCSTYLYMEHREELYNMIISNKPAVMHIRERKPSNSDYKPDKTNFKLQDNALTINCANISFNIKDFHLTNFANFLKLTISDEIIKSNILKKEKANEV
jgi:hypothetical protein